MCACRPLMRISPALYISQIAIRSPCVHTIPHYLPCFGLFPHCLTMPQPTQPCLHYSSTAICSQLMDRTPLFLIFEYNCHVSLKIGFLPIMQVSAVVFTSMEKLPSRFCLPLETQQSGEGERETLSSVSEILRKSWELSEQTFQIIETPSAKCHFHVNDPGKHSTDSPQHPKKRSTWGKMLFTKTMPDVGLRMPHLDI